MTTEKNIMHIKNIMNLHVGEEEKMVIEKIKKCLETDEVLPKNLKNCMLVFFNYVLNGDENLEEKILNMQFDENDINFLKEMHKKMVGSKMFPPFFDKIDDVDYNFLLDMKNENLKKSLYEKYF